MSSIGTTGSTLTNSELEQPHVSHILLNTNMNPSKIENSPADRTATQIDTGTFSTTTTPTSTQTLPLKTQVLPLVYFQAPPQKIGFPTNTKSSNVIVNNVPQFQFASLGANAATKNPHNLTLSNLTVSGSQSVILAPMNNQGKPQQIVIQKPTGNVLPTYVTMLKPMSKPPDQPLQVTTADAVNLHDNIQIVSSAPYQAPSTGKYVIAPMPKITTNRLPATVTTNSVQPKIAFMPLTPTTSSSVDTSKKVFNFRISDGQIQPAAQVKIIQNYAVDNQDEASEPEDDDDRALVCDEIIDLDSPEKEPQEKSYELSIEEDSPPTSSSGMVNTDQPSESLLKVATESKLIIQKEAPKFSKHGVSILKKNYSVFDRRPELQNTLTINKLTNSSYSFSDPIVETNKPSTSSETIILPEPKVVQKTGGRRKSHFSYRKEYDDVSVENYEFKEETKTHNVESYKQNFDIVLTKLNAPEGVDINENEDKSDKNVEIEVIKEKVSDMKENIENACDMQKILKWEEGIGTLPGSNLKFIINEFNLIEYVTQEEYNKIIERRITKAKERAKEDFNEVMQCMECGCYGLPSEFISPKYCSYDCQEAGDAKFAKEKESKVRRKAKKEKRVLTKKPSEVITNDTAKTEPKQEKEQSASDEDNTSNENSQDKFSYPWNCSKKGFSWAKYLDHVKAKAAPVKLFKDAFPYTRNGFRSGMKLEGIDPQHPSYFCVLTVVEVIGYRLRLHFDGYPDNYDFWVNADSMDIFPIGWCEKYGHDLHPPPGYTMDNFNWVNYLKQTKSTAAPKHLFANRAGNAICPNGFRVGMKLEAVDRKNNMSLVCVASVRDMMDNRILVHFDSWDDIYDYWADPTSPYIHPVGWCDQYGHSLTPPNDHPNPESFTWETYLRSSGAVAAPARAFKQRPASGFRRGMRLECVDRRAARLVRAATVDDVAGHRLRLHFDGWPDRYGYWVDDDSADIHPVGWCQKTDHPIEPPLTPDDVYDFLECPTVGCKGIGHIKGPQYATHSSQKFCPYAEENIDAERVLPDRLLSPDLQIEAVVPVSREPKEKVKPRLGRPPKYPRLEPVKVEELEPEPEPPVIIEKKPIKRKYTRRVKVEPGEAEEKKLAVEFLEQSKVSPAEQESWPRHSQFLQRYVRPENDPSDWTVGEVSAFVRSLPNCETYGNVFREHEIDGEAMLLLNQSDIIDILRVKLGPAVKIYNSIVLLRSNAV